MDEQPDSTLFPGLDSSYRTAVHPNLVAELRSFQGQLEAQISHANAFYHVEQQQMPPPADQSQHLYANQQIHHQQQHQQHQHQQHHGGCWHQHP